MSNVIRVLDSIGHNASLRFGSDDRSQVAVDAMELGRDEKSAILSNDQEALYALSGAKASRCCMVAPGKDDDEEEVPNDDDEITSLDQVTCMTV